MKKTLQKSDEERQSNTDRGSKSVSWFSVLKQSWRAALQFDRSKITAFQAIRSTIGFVIPLALGVATGHVVEGVSIASGALMLGSVGLTYTYHARNRTMLLACVGIGLSALVGGITGRIDWLAILVAGIWGIGAGLLVSISQAAMIIGLQSAIALIILSGFAFNPAYALIQAGLMFAGALLQVALAIIALPWKNRAPELSALSAVYQKLADYAIDPANDQSEQQLQDALLQAQSTLSDSDIESQQGKIFFGLLEEAEQIRLSLIILTRLRQNLKEGVTPQTGRLEYLDQILQSAASELREIANELKPTQTLVRRTRPHQQIKKSLSALRRQDKTPQDEEKMQQALAYADVLRDQLHTAKKLAKSWKYPNQRLSVHLPLAPRQAYLRLHNALATLRANLTLRSAAFRHAIRLGVTLALATAIYRLIPLPVERGYWIPLTALLVLRPDFTTTFSRDVARLLGTMLGAVLTTLLVSVLAPSQVVLVILNAIVTYIAFSVLFANYAIFSAFITVEIVLLLAFVTPQPLIIAAYRAIDTAVGGILALLIYVLWPTWEHLQVLDNIANRLDALRHYLVAVMQAYANPNKYDEHTIHRLRMDSRLARSNAVASVERLLQEPVTHGIDTDLVQGLLGAADNIARSALALEAYLLDNPSRHALPEITTFSSKVDEALGLLATAIRERQPVKELPNLQEALRTLEHSWKSGKHTQVGSSSADLRFFISEAKRIIESINTMNELLSTRPEKPAPG
jgi:uncharacterized membrane protein YccC